MQNQKRICIAGGGPGGLTLARILHRFGIDFTVLEGDAHALVRPQGGSLDLHADSGQLALHEAGLHAQFAALARYDDQYDAIYDHRGTLHLEFADSAEGDRPEIDRTQLRDLLLASIPAEKIRWGVKASSIEPLADGRFRVGTASAPVGDFDLVVGSDGAWSKVRPLVSSKTPAYTGLTFVELAIDNIDERHPDIAALIPRGKISVVGGNQGLIAQRSSGGHVRAYFIFRVPADWIQRGALDLSSTARARVSLKRHLPGWDPKFLAFIDACNDGIVTRPCVALPVGHRWAHRPGVTLLGDAAHVMPPFSGEGVNMAMLDAAELARSLARDDDWNRAVSQFEERMFLRAAEAAAGALKGCEFASENALEFVLEEYATLAMPNNVIG